MLIFKYDNRLLTLLVCLSLFFFTHFSEGTTYTVTTNSDDGTSGTLRNALLNSINGDSIYINPGVGTITVGSSAIATALPYLQGVTIYGNGNTISGNGGIYPIFFAYTGTNSINDLTLFQGSGVGGLGGSGAGGGGGGLGAGGALFIWSGVTVNASNIIFSENEVSGGNGGSNVNTAGYPGGGGGGLFSSQGGDGLNYASGGGGGGGLFNSAGGGSISQAFFFGDGGGGGGGLYGSSGGEVNVTTTAGGGGGGGFYLSPGGAIIETGGSSGSGGGGGGVISSAGGGASSGNNGGGFGGGGYNGASGGNGDTSGGGGGGTGSGNNGGNAVGSTVGAGGSPGSGFSTGGGNGGLGYVVTSGSPAGPGQPGVAGGSISGGGGGGGGVNNSGSGGSLGGGAGGNANIGGGGGGGGTELNSGSNAPAGAGGSSAIQGGGGGGGYCFNHSVGGAGGSASIGGGGGGGGVYNLPASSVGASGGASSILGGGGGGGGCVAVDSFVVVSGSGGNAYIGGGGGGGGCVNTSFTAVGRGGNGGSSVFGGGGGGAGSGAVSGVAGTGGFGGGNGGSVGSSGGGGSALGGAVFVATGGTFNLSGCTFSNNFLGAAGVGSSSGTSAGSDMYIMSGTTPVFTGTAVQSLGGSIAGTGALTVSSASTVTLSGANTYIGTTTINSGTLVFVGDTSQLPSNIVNHSALMFNQSLSSTYSGVITGTGSVTVAEQSFQILTLNGQNTYSGSTIVSAGSLKAGAVGAFSPNSAFTVGTNIFNHLELNNYNQTIGSLSGGGPVDGAAGLVFLGSGGLTLGGNNLDTTFTGGISGSGGIIKNGAGTFTLAGAPTYLGTTTVNSGTMVISHDLSQLGGNIVNSSDLVLSAVSSVYFGIISGSGAVAMNGSDQLDLYGKNTYTGTTTINSGSLFFIGDTSPLGSNIVNNSHLIFSQTISSTYSSAISGPGTVLLSGTPRLVLTGSNTYSGTTLVYGGTLQAGRTNTFSPNSPLFVTDFSIFGNVDLNGFDQTVASLSGGTAGGANVALGTGTLTLGGNNNSTTFAGFITGTGGITKQGTGFFALTNANTYLGTTTINGGTLILNGDTSQLVGNIVNSSALLFNQPYNTTFSHVISGTGTLNYHALSFNTILVLSGANTYTGTTTVEFAVLDFAGDMSQLGSNIVNNDHLIFSQASNTTYNSVISGTGAFAKTGTGVLVFTGSNTYSGSTAISAGILRGGAVDTFSPNSTIFLSNTSGVSLDLNNFNQTIGSLSGGGSSGGNVTLGTGILALGSDGSTTVYSGVISGGGGIIKEGTGIFTLNATNTYTGTTTISGGQLVFQQSVLQSLGNIVDNASLVFNLSSNSTYSSVISGSGEFIHEGLGSLTLSGINTYQGLTIVEPVSGVLYFINDTSQMGGGLVNNGLVVFEQPNNSTFGGPISGAGTIIKSPVSTQNTLVLTGESTYTGDILIVGGTVSFTGNTSLMGGTLNVGNFAILDFNQIIDSSYSGLITGYGNFNKNGAGNLVLSGANTYAGITTINSGTLTFSADTSQWASNVVDNSSLAFNLISDSTFASNISGSGNVTQEGPGTLVLLGTNTYTGTTSVLGGTLKLGKSNSLPFNSTIYMGNVSGAVLDLNNFSETIGTLSGGGTSGGNVLLESAVLTIGNNNGSGTYSGVISGSGGITKVGSGSQTLVGVNTYLGTTTVSAGTLIFAGDTSQLGGNIIDDSFLVFDQTSDSTFSNVISGSGTVIQTGSTNLILSGINTYTGTTTILSGSLTFTADTSLLGGNIVDDSVLIFNEVSDLTFNQNISGSGAVNKIGGATLIFTGLNTYSGTTTVSSGTLRAGALNTFSPNSTISMGNVSGAILDLNNFSETVGGLSGGGSAGGNVTLGTGELTLGGNNASVTYSGVISGSGGITKVGIGSQTLAGVNTYLGTTTVSAGTLIFTGDTSQLGGNIIDDSALVFDQTSDSAFSNIISGSGAVIQSGSATLTLSGINTYTGTTTILSGTLTFAADTSGLGGNIVDDAVLVFNEVSNSAFNQDISGSGVVNKIGSATLVFTGSNTYSGTTMIDAGTLQAGAVNTFSPNSVISMADVSGAILDLNSFDQAIAGLSGGGSSGGNVTLGSGELTVGGNNTSSIYAGIISGSGGITKQGTGSFTLTGRNTYAGDTTVSQGELIFTSDTSALGGNINDGATVTFDQSANSSFPGSFVAIGVNPVVNVFGSGLLNLTGNSAGFSGTINVGGNLAVNGFLGNALSHTIVQSGGVLSGIGTLGNVIVNSGGSVAPGNSIGTINFLSYTNNGGDYIVQIDGVGNCDLINVSGTATINGGFVIVDPINGAYEANHTYTIVHAQNLTGQYAGVVASALITPSLIYDSQNVYLDFSLHLERVAVTPNERAVAIQLDSIDSPTIPQTAFLNKLVNLSPSEVRVVLNELSGQQHTDDLFMTEIINRQFIRRLYDPVRSIITTTCSCPCRWDPFWGNLDVGKGIDAWMESGGGNMYLNGNNPTHRLNIDGYEITAGVQKEFFIDERFCPGWTFGGAVSYESDRFHYQENGKGTSKSWLFGLYSVYRPKGYYGLIDIVYGNSLNHLKRSVEIPGSIFIMRSKPQISQYTFYGEMGIDLSCRWFLIQPFAGLEARSYLRQRVVEDPIDAGGWELIIHKRNDTSVFSRLGLHLTANELPYHFSISGDLGWNKRLTQLHNKIQENFVEFGDTFTIKGNRIEGISLDYSLTVSTKISKNWKIYIETVGEVWNQSSTYNVLGGVEFVW